MRRRVVWTALSLALGVALIGCTLTSKDDLEERPGAVDPPAGPTTNALAELPTIAFRTAAGEPVQMVVEVADSAELRTCGLMHRTSLPADQGMLFVFEEDSAGGFWMRNTIIPLSIAYISGDGRIVDIVEMSPAGSGNTPYQTPDGTAVNVPDGQRPPAGSKIVVYPPRARYRYAVEANARWYEQKGIGIGDEVDLSDALQRGSAGQPPPLCQEKGT